MIQAGDIQLADIGHEQREPVLVLSNERFHRIAERVFVAPSRPAEPAEVLAPWHIPIGGRVFLIDRLRTLPTARLLESLGRASSTELAAARRALRLST